MVWTKEQVALRSVFLHSIGGASGDMILGALVDAGLPLEHLEEELAKLPAGGCRLSATPVQRGHVAATHLVVELSKEATPLSPQELLRCVESSALEGPVKEQATRVLLNLLEAECRVHRVPQEELTLHELGSWDTVIDVVGTVAGLRRLGIEKVFASPLVVGASQPQRPRDYPVPAPATLELASMAGAPVEVHQGVSHEMTTPTGAALLTTLATFQAPHEFKLSTVGYGAGAADLQAFPNVLAAWVGEVESSSEDSVILLETNLDDAQGLVLGYVHERLLAQGALDVWLTPIQMKKNRPGVLLSVLVPSSLRQDAIQTILQETPTLGVRVRAVERQIAHRETVEFQSQFGPVMIKVKHLGGQPVAVAPEYEDCRRLALEKGIPFQELYQQVLGEARARLVP